MMDLLAKIVANLRSRVKTLESSGGGGGESYLVYSARVAKTSGLSAAPDTITVFRNTLAGTPVWGRDGSDNHYTATLAGAFPLAKTFVQVSPGGFGSFSGVAGSQAIAYRESDDVVRLGIRDEAGSPNNTDFWCYIEIRVYP